MKLTVVTVCFNSAATIEDTVRSVLSQDYKNLEYIIIDGASRDNTLEVIAPYRDKISKIISEPDKGLYDALNKGISLSTGEIIGFLHADDFFADCQVLSRIASAFSANTDGVYGDLEYVNATDTTKVIRKWKSGSYRPGDFLRGWMPPHPALYLRRHVYEKYGGFDLSLRSSADYELMLRFIHRYQISLKYVPSVFVRMRVGGMSNASAAARKKAFFEDLRAWELNGYGKNYLAVVLKKIKKLQQWL